MGSVGGVPPSRGGEQQKIEIPEMKVKAAGGERIPSNWAEAIKKYPQLLHSTVKMMAMKIMKEMRKSASKRMKD